MRPFLPHVLFPKLSHFDDPRTCEGTQDRDPALGSNQAELLAVRRVGGFCRDLTDRRAKQSRRFGGGVTSLSGSHLLPRLLPDPSDTIVGRISFS